jgi:hypothetical protein
MNRDWGCSRVVTTAVCRCRPWFIPVSARTSAAVLPVALLFFGWGLTGTALYSSVWQYLHGALIIIKVYAWCSASSALVIGGPTCSVVICCWRTSDEVQLWAQICVLKHRRIPLLQCAVILVEDSSSGLREVI